MKFGLLHNANSRRNRRGRADIERILSAQRPDLEEIELAGVDGLDQALERFADRGVTALIINAGDGTVQAVLSRLCNDSPFGQIPPIALLPGGSTNVIAYDVGTGGNRARALGRLLKAAETGTLKTVPRATIRVDHAPDRSPLYGTFFGTAAVYRAIGFHAQVIRPMRLDSSWAMGATMAGVLLRYVFRRSAQDPIFHGDSFAIAINDQPAERQDLLVAMVTTLDRLILKTRPYWGSEPGDLRFTGIRYPVRGLIRAIRSVLYGGKNRRFPSADYFSHNADRLSFDMTCRFALDGEIYDPVPGYPIQLSTGPWINYVIG
jgi:diacylglycerol kinase family enzyme